MKSKDKLLKKLQEVEDELKQISDMLKEQDMEDRVSAVQELLDRIRFNEITYENLEHALNVERDQIKDAFIAGFEVSSDVFNGEVLQWSIHNEMLEDHHHILEMAKDYYDTRYNK